MLRLATAIETSNVRAPAVQTPSAAMFRPRFSRSASASCGEETTALPGSVRSEYSLRTPKPPKLPRDTQYLGSSSMLSLSIEAGSLAEETLRQKSASPARSSSNRGSGVRRTGSGDVRLESLEETLEQNEQVQVETIGALRKLSSISSNVASWFPYYGHTELRIGAGGASMKIPEREEAEELADGTNLFLDYIGFSLGSGRV